MNTSFRDELQKYTLEYYEREFTDRHLVHGAMDKWSRECPDRVALIVTDTGQQFTYADLQAEITRWALELVALGFRPGEFLATMLPLTAEQILLEYACFKVGVIHAPLDMRLKSAEVVRSLQLIEAQGFAFLGATPFGDFGEVGRVVQAECPFVQHLLHFAPPHEVLPGAVAGSALCQRVRDQAQRPLTEHPAWSAYREAATAVKPTDGAQVIYTTGSTGSPKPALLSHRNITAQNMCLMAGFGMQDHPRQLVNLPASHVGCQAEQLMTTFFAGGTAVVMHMFDAEKTLRAIQDHRVQLFGQIPAMFHLQWQLPHYQEYDLSSVTKAIFGGQTVTQAFVERLLQMIPLVGTGLGLTEMAGFVTYTGMTDRAADLVPGVGWWMPITPLTIREPMRDDGSAGAEMPSGQTGEICFSGPQVFIEYVNDPQAYRRTVSTDGICYTGDLGYVCDQGLIFAGRSKLVIKPKGYQVHPGQVEEHFAQLRDQVAVCGAVGAPHDLFVETIVLFVERRQDAVLDVAALAQHAQGIAAYMRPSHYVILEPGQFPLNRVAKTDYVRLSELARVAVNPTTHE